MWTHGTRRSRKTGVGVLALLLWAAVPALAACGGGSGPAPTASPSARSTAGSIAFVRVTPLWTPVHDLCVVSPDGTALEVLDDGPGFKFHPSWSPDGSRIVYAVLPESEELSRAAALWVVKWDGSGKRRLTEGPLRVTCPRGPRTAP
jgi:hypothetical protein